MYSDVDNGVYEYVFEFTNKVSRKLSHIILAIKDKKTIIKLPEEMIPKELLHESNYF